MEAFRLALVNMFFVLCSSGIVYAMVLLRKQLEHFENKDAREMVMTVLNRTEAMAKIVVAQLEQTVVKNLKEASSSGKLSLEDIKVLQNKALSQLKNLLQTNVKETLGYIVGDVDSFLRGLLEKEVLELKKEK